MCYDQEKTQAPEETRRARDFEIREAGGQIGRAIPGCERSQSEILAELFSYHPPTPFTLPKFSAINQAAKNFAEVILQNCPPGADRRRVIQMIRDARMVANASVALNGLSL